MGLGDDRTFAGNASVFDSSHRIYPEKDNYKRDSAFGCKRRGGRRRSQSVRSACNSACLHDRNGKYHRCRNSDRSGRSGSCILVLDHGHFRNCNEVCRIAYCGKVQSKNRRRANAGRCDVCAGARTEYEVARFGVRFFGRFCFFWNRMRDSGKRDRGSVQ